MRNVLLYSGDREIANDAVAEAFAQAMRRGEAVRDPLAWVTRAAFKIAAGALKERRRTDYPLAERPYEMPEPAVELVAAFARLSPKQRAAVDPAPPRRLHPCRGRRHHRARPRRPSASI